ncbi:FKBP-type peptidyl-prolyl cis-trans isomerase [Georgenia sp. Z1344]|uniref:FKBP-type peptidyl-prolyl cis-trans isomerase n=1 Tax=Georgenia sp. Z1344 TaxID=3416706 RepID=UPI003CF9E24B
MRRPIRLVTAALLGASLALAGCTGSDEEESTDGSEQPSDGEAATPAGEDLPTVSTEVGETPVVEFPGSGAPETLQTEVVVEGDGAEVGADDVVVANYSGQIWDGEVFDSSFDRGAPTAFSLNQVIPGWKEGLTGTHVGDRVVISIPPEDGYGETGQPAAGIGPEDTLLFVVDVVDTFAPDAQAEADATPVEPAPDLPVTIEGDLGSAATIAVEEGAEEPTEMTTHVIAEGSGDPVPETPGSTVVLQYAAASWDGSTTESTWELGSVMAQPVGMGSVADALTGVPVGSRVVVLAPALAEQGVPSSAFVFDVVGAVEGPPVEGGESPSESGSESGSGAESPSESAS